MGEVLEKEGDQHEHKFYLPLVNTMDFLKLKLSPSSWIEEIIWLLYEIVDKIVDKSILVCQAAYGGMQIDFIHGLSC